MLTFFFLPVCSLAVLVVPVLILFRSTFLFVYAPVLWYFVCVFMFLLLFLLFLWPFFFLFMWLFLLLSVFCFVFLFWFLLRLLVLWLLLLVVVVMVVVVVVVVVVVLVDVGVGVGAGVGVVVVVVLAACRVPSAEYRVPPTNTPNSTPNPNPVPHSRRSWQMTKTVLNFLRFFSLLSSFPSRPSPFPPLSRPSPFPLPPFPLLPFPLPSFLLPPLPLPPRSPPPPRFSFPHATPQINNIVNTNTTTHAETTNYNNTNNDNQNKNQQSGLTRQLHHTCNPLSAFHQDAVWLDLKPDSKEAREEIGLPFCGPPNVSCNPEAVHSPRRDSSGIDPQEELSACA